MSDIRIESNLLRWCFCDRKFNTPLNASWRSKTHDYVHILYHICSSVHWLSSCFHSCSCVIVAWHTHDTEHMTILKHLWVESCAFAKTLYANEPLRGTDACTLLLLSLLCVNSDQFTHTEANRRLTSHPFPARKHFRKHLKSTACTVQYITHFCADVLAGLK